MTFGGEDGALAECHVPFPPMPLPGERRARAAGEAGERAAAAGQGMLPLRPSGSLRTPARTEW